MFRAIIICVVFFAGRCGAELSLGELTKKLLAAEEVGCVTVIGDCVEEKFTDGQRNSRFETHFESTFELGNSRLLKVTFDPDFQILYGKGGQGSSKTSNKIECSFDGTKWMRRITSLDVKANSQVGEGDVAISDAPPPELEAGNQYSGALIDFMKLQLMDGELLMETLSSPYKARKVAVSNAGALMNIDYSEECYKGRIILDPARGFLPVKMVYDATLCKGHGGYIEEFAFEGTLELKGRMYPKVIRRQLKYGGMKNEVVSSTTISSIDFMELQPKDSYRVPIQLGDTVLDRKTNVVFRAMKNPADVPRTMKKLGK
jgi:hypothetical protein